MIIAGAGTAFAFIPVSIAALAGVRERQAGLASGLLNTSQQLGGAIGIAVASGVAASHTKALLPAGNAAPAALTGGFQSAFWGAPPSASKHQVDAADVFQRVVLKVRPGIWLLAP